MGRAQRNPSSRRDSTLPEAALKGEAVSFAGRHYRVANHSAVTGKAVGQHAACRIGADDDEVELLGSGHRASLSRSAGGSGMMPPAPFPTEATMPIVRNIDVTMQSEVSFDDACRLAVAEAAKTLRGIMSFRIKDAECVVEHDKIIAFRVTGKIVFLVER
jgi:dodecin